MDPERDLLVLTADHGCDPVTPGTDHTREHAPLLAWFAGHGGRRHDGPMADVGASALRWLTGGERRPARASRSCEARRRSLAVLLLGRGAVARRPRRAPEREGHAGAKPDAEQELPREALRPARASATRGAPAALGVRGVHYEIGEGDVESGEGDAARPAHLRRARRRGSFALARARSSWSAARAAGG